MNYNKDKKRARLSDKSVESVIHARDIAKVFDNVAEPFAPTDVNINLEHALDHKLELMCVFTLGFRCYVFFAQTPDTVRYRSVCVGELFMSPGSGTEY